ncbi:MAG: hypothetical protein RLZZ15_2003 [Verrucomicrobiota bacterium]
MSPLAEKEYVLFCDESDRRGPFYSNFYGGARVPASHLRTVEVALLDCRQRLGLNSEIKWEKVGPGVVERYEQFIAAFFDQIAARRVFLRVMFTHNLHAPIGLTREQLGDSYYRLYYQFLKHGFGLAYLPPHTQPPRLRIYLDEIGDTREQVAKFKDFVLGLPDTKTIRAAGGLILEDSAITEVRSHDHIIMQALDVVLGSTTFRLNNKHLAKLPGEDVRGKRTVAKERLYNFIRGEIKRVTGKQSFNIGITTGLSDFPSGRWSDPYLHWCFMPRDHALDRSMLKP